MYTYNTCRYAYGDSDFCGPTDYVRVCALFSWNELHPSVTTMKDGQPPVHGDTTPNLILYC